MTQVFAKPEVLTVKTSLPSPSLGLSCTTTALALPFNFFLFRFSSFVVGSPSYIAPFFFTIIAPKSVRLQFKHGLLLLLPSISLLLSLLTTKPKFDPSSLEPETFLFNSLDYKLFFTSPTKIFSLPYNIISTKFLQIRQGTYYPLDDSLIFIINFNPDNL